MHVIEEIYTDSLENGAISKQRRANHRAAARLTARKQQIVVFKWPLNLSERWELKMFMMTAVTMMKVPIYPVSCWVRPRGCKFWLATVIHIIGTVMQEKANPRRLNMKSR